MALAVLAQPACAQTNTNDDVLLQMKQAFQRGDKARLAALLPQATRSNPGPPTGSSAPACRRPAPDEYRPSSRYAGTYQEDRLRNDWLLLLGQRRQWDDFMAMHAAFRNAGRPRGAVRYAIAVDVLRTGQATKAQADTVRRNWFG